MKKQVHESYLLDDCWELIFQKLKEDDERDLESVSLVSHRLLSISNRIKLSLRITDRTVPLLSNLLRRFQHIKSIDIDILYGDADGLACEIARSRLLNPQALKLQLLKPPRDGFRALALNTNIKNSLKVLDCSRLLFIEDNDLVLIADSFPRLEKLKIQSVRSHMYSKIAARVTDDGVAVLASKLKELKEICFKCEYPVSVTDQSLISLSTNCVKLRKVSLWVISRDQHCVTQDGIGFVMRHSPNLTNLSLKLWSLQRRAFSFTDENLFTNAKNLHSLTMTPEVLSNELLCSVAKACPQLKKLKLVGFGDKKYPQIHMGLKLLFKTCQLEKLILLSGSLTDAGMSDLARYLSNLTFINIGGNFGLTSVTFYTLTKNCPLLEVLKLSLKIDEEMDNFCPDFLHKNYRMRHLDLCYNMSLNDTTLENFGQVCPNLQFLFVSGCRRLTNVGIGEVLKRCPAITELDIYGIGVSNVFGRYSEQSIVKLKTLKACSTRINDKAMAMIGNRCQYLQYLDIKHCKEVTDKGVLELVQNCNRLRDIFLFGCQNVSTNILPQMVLSRPSLRIISPNQLGLVT